MNGNYLCHRSVGIVDAKKRERCGERHVLFDGIGCAVCDGLQCNTAYNDQGCDGLHRANDNGGCGRGVINSNLYIVELYTACLRNKFK